MKKVLKIIGIFLGVVLLLLALSPLFFESTMEKLVKRTIDNNLNADVAWGDFDLSLFRSFPDAALTIKDFSVVNRAPFAGNTLASGELLKLDMGITQLFKSGDQPIIVDALYFEKTFVNIRVDSTGQTNYDIAVKSDAPLTDSTQTNNSFTFDLKRYELKESRINYLDEKTKTFIRLTDVNHTGTGDFSLAQSELDTETTALVSLQIEDIEYLSENEVALDAVFQMDLENQKYTFLENEARVNALPLTFNGFVKVNETNNEIDLTFKTPSSDFKNFLAVIPKTYVKELDGVTTTGNFTVDGMLKGVVDDTYIPKMDIKIASDNASFKYPDLPKAVQNISIDARLQNDTGLVKDTYLTIGALSFRIDDERFTANGSIRNLTENALVNLALKGTLNLANIEKVLPVEMEQELSGVFKADVTTNFDMNSVENEQYQNIKSQGTASLTNFTYNDGGFKNPVKISNANLAFTPGNIQLKGLSATSGETDIQASGTIQNLIPFLMSKQDLKGRFNLRSNTFSLNDFMSSEATTSESGTKASEATPTKNAIKIPDFLDATVDFSATKLIYDNLTLDNA
ncbi:MAG: AsmA family protein, partial [Altibacter sp.]|nr:AsmA family protein [Altibacter sp.]